MYILILILILFSPYFGGDTTPWLEPRPCSVPTGTVRRSAGRAACWLANRTLSHSLLKSVFLSPAQTVIMRLEISQQAEKSL